MNTHKRRALLLTVFLTGAAVLAIEVAAMRVLSVYYGSSVYVTSSVLGVILGALSLGYYFGGRLVDRFRSAQLFYGLIVAAGAAAVVMHMLIILALPSLAPELDPQQGSIWLSLLLFFVPSVLLGTLSPFAVALIHNPKSKSVGSDAGLVFLWSTLGSISGSIVTGFYLVTVLGVRTIMLATAVALIVLGALGLLTLSARRRSIAAVTAALLLAVAWSWVALQNTKTQGVIHEQDGLYSRITVTNGAYNNEPVRYMLLDRSLSSASYPDSDELVFAYAQYAQLLVAMKPEASRGLMTGGGNYSVPAYLARNMPNATVEVSEVEPALYDLSRQYFGLKDDPRLVNRIIDGRQALRGKDGAYDFMFGDAYHSVVTVPSHLTTREYFQEVKRSLKPDGVMMLNLIGRLGDWQPSYLLSQIKTIQEVFPDTELYATQDPTAFNRTQNLVLIAYNGQRPSELAAPQSERAAAFFATLPNYKVDMSKLALGGRRSYTDDFAPIDNHVAASVTNR